MELFRIGFLDITLVDILDIVLVSFIFYKLYMVMRGTIAAQIFVGLVLILAFSFVAQAIHFQAMNWILRTLTDIWVIAFIVLFQPELRRLLVLVGRNRVVRLFLRFNVEEAIEEKAQPLLDLGHRESPLRSGRDIRRPRALVDIVPGTRESSRMRKDLRPTIFVTGDVAGDVESPVYAILALNTHYDKRPMNALLAKSMEVCAQKKIGYFVYGNYVYGNKKDSSLVEFKRRNGFEQADYPRYYLPLTFKGRIYVALKLYRGISGLLPAPILALALRVRDTFYKKKEKTAVTKEATKED